MRGAAGLRRAALIACAVAITLAGAARSQDAAPQVLSVLTIDKERLFTDSAFGRSSIAQIEADIAVLQSENRRIEAGLEAEERALTERRQILPAEEFRALAAAFDQKVQGIRSARDAKGRELAARQESARQTFLSAAVPVLAKIMAEQGATVIIDRSAIILSFDRVDITQQAIARIDAELGKTPDTAPEAPPSPPLAPQPEPLPGPVPDAAP